MSIRLAPALVLLLAVPLPSRAQAKAAPETKPALSPATFAGLELRGIGPALTSGRVIDVAVDPVHPSTWFVATAGGGLWKTTTAGTTWKPVFEAEGSYSIGCVTLDPKDPLVVWVGSGENNSQRSVSYGDGVYKSTDGGDSWQNVGLKSSEHIGRIVIDPRNTDVVYVAAQGPLWNEGGDRGLYKTTDGGKSFVPSLKISENTGVSDVWLDPRNPDVLYATSYQRQRHVWSVVGGGSEGAIYKSRDAGANWKRLEGGLPKGDLGRIGLAISPANPDVVYALIEAADRKQGGTWRSENAGGTWERRSDYASSGQYYEEMFPDPKNADRVYAVDVFLHVTEDGGKSWHNAGEKDKHVDNHVVWIDPGNTDHLLNGNDGGLYETWDRAQTWRYFANLPVTQFYRVAVDDARPFYNVYGGTQDNHSLGGPSRTINAHGIANSDWFVTAEGDGFVSRADPTDANVVYAESQNGGLVRYNRGTGERVDIQPQPGSAEAPLRWNWDSPLIVSPHSPSRLYFAAQRLFRSDDRGDHWKSVGPDLTRQLDRNTMKLMGKVWSVDAVAKNTSTSFYGNIVSLAESSKQEGLLYVGADDGLIQ
ncbi:MAG: glycosyl hydrolase, partial [Vicinamibacteria bacterium]